MRREPVSMSSAQDVPVTEKVREWWSLFVDRLSTSSSEQTLEHVFNSLDEYDAYLWKYANARLPDASILEIGFGARPRRLIALLSRGCDAIGVDLDQPCLRGTPREFVSIYRRNGFERTLKTLVRWSLFDRRERRSLAQKIATQDGKIRVDNDRFLVMDASSPGFDGLMRERRVDLIVSEDVFEHMPTSALRVLVARMPHWLRPNGLALIRPNIFTGILGGHLVEWSKPLERRSRRRSEPWEHLRKKRYVGNTFLNELTRNDYRDLFSQHFEIAEEHVMVSDLGREFATPDVLADLRTYPPEELFSNHVLFVLRPHPENETSTFARH
jgi:hypothetical protein